MIEVLQQSPSPYPSPSSSSAPNDGGSHQHHHLALINNNNRSSPSSIEDIAAQSHLDSEEEEEEEEERKRKERERREGDQISLLAILVAAFRKSLVRGCSGGEGNLPSSMEIGWPSNVRHVAHVTFDRFNGFLGLPVEFEPEVPRRAPSASATVFGVSTESMQLSFDSRGNSVPTILLLMQRHLYARGGLHAEGIFRLTAGNSQEEYVRDQLNRGVVPEGVDVHCLAGLIKAWFRELPKGLLDSLSPEQVMESQTEEESVNLVRLLPPTESALLDWAVNLMADVAQHENHNKMNARNVAMVFAPNMTQMADPLTALMYAVQVMNFLKNLIERTLREREESVVDSARHSGLGPSDDDRNQSGSHQSYLETIDEEEDDNYEGEEESFVGEEPAFDKLQEGDDESLAGSESQNLLTSIENLISEVNYLSNSQVGPMVQSSTNRCEGKTEQSSSSNLKKGLNKINDKSMEKKNLAVVGRINSRTELAEAWR